MKDSTRAQSPITHTLTPWTVERAPSGLCEIQGSNNAPLGVYIPEADAAFIVRAVNAHEELLQAVKVLCDMAKKGINPSHERLEDYRRVIAKAKGK